MRTRAQLLGGVVLATLAGCAANSKDVGAVIPDTTPIWVPSVTPSPLGPIRLVPGDKARVSLLGAGSAPVRAISAASTAEPVGLATTIDGTALNLEAEKGSAGLTLVAVDLSLPGSITERVHFPVLIEPLPVLRFVYAPPAGKKVGRVALAGGFNGWSGDKDLMTTLPDGTFAIEKAIPPGSWTYKLVVDGEWIADPANPKQDSSGYGNSLLEVAGSATKPLVLQYVSALVPGTGKQGSFVADTPLDASSITVLHNNKALDAGAWSLSPDGTTILLNVPAGVWRKENFLTVVGRSTDKRPGMLTVQATEPDAPRSPRDEVIYFAFTDRFVDGNPALNKPATDPNVAPLANYHGGDFAGIQKKIEEGYFEKLGVTTLWLSPVNKNTQKVEKESVAPGRYYTSYHGYWPTSLTETNEQFGSMDDLKSLVSTAHRNRVAILLDFVSNHVHEDHPIVQEVPDLKASLKLPDGRDNIRLFDEHPFSTWFDTFLPDLDYDKNPQLIETMTENAIWWLRTTGADGFRHDAVKHVPLPYWRRMTERLNTEIVEKEGRAVYQVGETISGHDTVARFIGPDLMQGQFDFPTYFTIQSVLARGDGKMSDLGTAIRQAERYYPPSSIMSPLLGNHDVARFMGYADGDLPPGQDEKEIGWKNPPKVDDATSYAKILLGFAYLTAIPGPPTIYYGDEIGLTGAHDPDNRRPMPWQWTAQQQANFDATAALNKVRLGSVALRRGTTDILDSRDESLVVARVSPGEVVLVALARKGGYSGTVTLPAAWGSPKALEPLTGASGAMATAQAGTVSIKLPAYGYGFWKVTW